jgi:adenosine deaminase
MHYSQVHNSTIVSPDLEQRIHQMPKVELHVHLEGATHPETTYKMAQRNGITLPVASLEEWKTYYTFRDFNHFIDVYLLVAAAMQTPEDYISMVESYMHSQFEHNIQYSEVFFSPLLHKDKFPASVLLEALSEGLHRGETKYGTRVQFIPDISREMASKGEALRWYVLEFAAQAKSLGIGVGMGLAGKEIGFPPEMFADIFAEAKQQGLRIVAHGGETGGADSVRGAIHKLQAERIGHGVRAVEDESLVSELQQRQIPLEVSPQSNYCLGVVRRDQPHPIRQLVDAGVYCTVNTDDPPFFSTDLSNEYLTLAAQGFSYNELWQLNLNALNAAFLSSEEKRALEKQWKMFLKME